LQQRLGVGTRREKRRVAERNLAGITDQQHQAEADDRVDADEVKLRQHIAADQVRRCEQHQEKQPIPEDLSAVLKQADVLRVIGLEDETHQLLLLRMIFSEDRCPLFGIMR
jgi:hypothetical protein